MKKLYLACATAILCLSVLNSCKNESHSKIIYANTELEEDEDEAHEEYDGPAQRDSLEFERTKDPKLGYVPYNRLWNAIEYTQQLKNASSAAKTQSLLWQERGPVYDSVGVSNSNGRGGNAGYTGAHTAGRMRAVCVDTLNDPTGNTVLAAGISGGVWRTNNFLAASPQWQPVSDYYENLAVSSICQDPSNPSIMYFSTGEASSNVDAVFGRGVWKSMNGGFTWSVLPSTVNFIRNFKILCDAAGNVYLAARPTTTPSSQPYGLLRSKDGGTTWSNITPSGLTSNAICTDIELSAGGRLHASFGYTGTVVNHRFTDDPANVTSGTWSASSGIRLNSTVAAARLELASKGSVLYAITTNSGHNIDSCYKSADNGTTWVKQNASAFTTGVANGQGWYNITLAINPANTNEIIMGGLDTYKSSDEGKTVSRLTYWTGVGTYVHADQHYMQWWNKGTESRMVIGCDGGLFYSKDAGATFNSKNKGLGLKQFYAAAIHPAAGSPYLLAGAQDNGVHQLKNDGLSYSTEVTGGDGCFVHINQKDPNIQFGSYVYNTYRRSTNGGQTWSSLQFSGTNGLFVNPFDYDDNKNIMYATWAADNILRWKDANTSASANLLTITGLGTPSAFKVSPYASDRLFVGTTGGKLYKVNNANVISTSAEVTANATNIRGASFPAGNINCINIGTSDDNIVAVFSNYGVNNVWITNDGGTSWMAIDGNLPDMPVRWAVFVPGTNDKLILATEAGVYMTQQVNGGSTEWLPNASFPIVRTDMLKVRASDNTIVAATHGRGLYTAQIPAAFISNVGFVAASSVMPEQSTFNKDCRGYTDYTINTAVVIPTATNTNATIAVQNMNGAKQGIDFEYTTNGDFDHPSDQLTFVAGETGVKQVSVRIYDDADVEGDEQFTLAINVNGAAGAGTNQQHTVTITDHDAAPKVYGTSMHSFGSYNGDVVSASPFASAKVKNRLQVLFTAAELKAAGITRAANITSISINVLQKNSTKDFKGFSVSMAHAPVSTLSGGFVPAAFTQVYLGNYATVAGVNNINFVNPFAWDGINNVVVQFCFDNAGSAADAASDVIEGNAGPLGGGVRASTYSNHTTETTAGCSLPASYVSDFRINATLGAQFGNEVATAVHTAKTEYQNAGNDIYYYGPSGEVIARVHNLSNHNFGCTQVEIDRAGTGAFQFWNNNRSDFLMNKTFRFVPSVNHTTVNGTYEVTLYYTQQEKEGWEAATGQSWSNIQLVKLPSIISNVTPSNTQPDGAGSISVVTPVRGRFGSGYTLTYTFENGMGAIGAGIPGRMNTLLTLEGKLNGNDVLLNWKTSAEINSTGFVVEKSYDGIHYHTLASVAAAGNKLSQSQYSLTDAEDIEVNYYRVRMKHADFGDIVSNTVMVRNTSATQRMMVLSNPFINEIHLRFAKVPTTPLTVTLYDINGKLVKQYHTQPGSNDLVFYNINTGNVYARSIYLLDVYVDGKHYKERLMRQ